MTGTAIARWPRLALALALVLAACQAPGSPPQPRPSASAADRDGRLAAADARMYAGDYDGAEAAYSKLAVEGVRGAASHYSTLLAYESRFKEAVAQARAGVSQSEDSSSLARLVRALDWAEDLPDALRHGSRAVAAGAADPLAHIFYSEALADAGRLGEAEAELKKAERLGGDAYVRAELEREWANYHRGRRDQQSELNHLKLALKNQPRFPERQLELARYQYVNKNPEAARQVVDRLVAGHPANYPVLVGAADSAYLGGDSDSASALYDSALRARPGGAAAALGRAEIDVAVKRDFGSAHDLLIDALRRDPGSGPLYRFLHYLDLLVLKTDPDAELKAIAPQPPGDLEAARQAALERVNSYRSALGVPALAADPALAEGAEAHAYYYLFNRGRPQLAGLGIHAEDAHLPGFSGENVLLRARHFGYSGTRGAEVINHVFTPQASIQIWIDSVFHRYPLLDRESRVAGYGEAQIGVLSITVLDLGLGPTATGEPVLFPADGQRDVPAAFTGNEVPDPVPSGSPYPVGYPVTFQAGGSQRLAVTVGRLLGPDGQEVPSYTLNPADRVGASEWALLARQPLRPGATYTVELIGRLDDRELSRRWQFTVAS